MKKKKRQHKDYIEFLEARVNSKNYKNSGSEEEYKKNCCQTQKGETPSKIWQQVSF